MLHLDQELAAATQINQSAIFGSLMQHTLQLQSAPALFTSQ
jgi:hypothetical protein